jgi:FkbM family methyltransferase
VFTRLAAASRVIVDVGANIGLYACLGAAQLPDGGRLIAFEPVPANLEFLRRNLDRNGLRDRVDVEAAAAGQAPGELVIHLVPDNIALASASRTRATNLHSTESVSAPVVTLDSYFEARPDLQPDIIKTDTEGYDGYVLRGAGDHQARTADAFHRVPAPLAHRVRLRPGQGARHRLRPLPARVRR